MAKSFGFFGLRRGSTKSLTFSVLEGKQITKDRVTGGKNPRSNAQMQQRMCMATASAGYAAMKRIVDHSFEGYSYGRNNMSRFISLNTKALKDNLGATNSKFGYNPYGDRQLRMGAYIMSEGNASDIKNFNAGNATIVSKKLQYDFNISDLTQTSSVVVNGNSILEDFGVKVGDMATWVGIAAIDGQPTNEFFFVRIKFLKGGTTAVTSENLSEYITIESDHNVAATVGNAGTLHLEVTANDANGYDVHVLASTACIHSVKGDGYWLRNNTQLFTHANGDYLEHEEDAIATYPVGETYILNGGAI